jgi:fructokinase
MRIGVDLGGTKIEALALSENGQELLRYRVDTPREQYQGTIDAIAGLVARLEGETGQTATVGVGIPGTIRAASGLVKNSNSTWLNGRPLSDDLSRALGREARLANDANCLAVSEATDGAGHGTEVVFAVILGTGCGGGVAFRGGVHAGPNGIAGEWGHTPLPWASASELPGPPCYCGRRGCMEQWVSGPGAARDYLEATGTSLTMREIAAAAEAGKREAVACIDRLASRLARGLTVIADVLDPDVIILGGGVSRIERLYQQLPELIRSYAFGGDFDTPIRPALFGDSSGVRGAAWLWPAAGAASTE